MGTDVKWGRTPFPVWRNGFLPCGKWGTSRFFAFGGWRWPCVSHRVERRARPGRGHAHLRARGMDAALCRAVPLFPQPTPHTRGASRACRPCPREGTPDPINGSHRDPAKRKRATSWEVGRLTYRALPITCFLTGNPQFHRRGVVSRSCSTALLTRDSVTSVMRLRTSSLPWIGWRSLRYSPVL